VPFLVSALVSVGVAGLPAGCGRVGSEKAAPQGPDMHDAGSSQAEDVLDAGTDAAPDVEAVRDGASSTRCRGASYETSPSGAPCDPRRIEQARGLEGTCYGPAVGEFCDELLISVPASDRSSVPPGFVCGSPELGVVTCTWSFAGDASRVLDSAALEGACAATVAFPTVTVSCVLFGD
jgi:hypothetical protein